jgi:peroxiredoxin family protein
MSAAMNDTRLSILLLSGTHDRAHYAFVIAAGAAALGRHVQLFASNAGCHALLKDWSGLQGADRDDIFRARGVGGLAELREACMELGVSLLACEAGLRAEAIDPARLMADVIVTGIAHFLGEAGLGQIISL